MNRRDSRRSAEDGFTLIEVLVTVLILGILAGVLFPVIVQQADEADPTAAATALDNVRSGIELFRLDVRPREPSDLEQLANQITTAESDIDGDVYTVGDSTNWNGSYIDVAVSTGAGVNDTVTITGFDAAILNGLHIFDKSANEVNSNVATEDFLAVKLRGLSSDQFSSLNDEIDGENESNASTTGNLRFLGGSVSDSTFYLVVPKRKS